MPQSAENVSNWNVEWEKKWNMCVRVANILKICPIEMDRGPSYQQVISKIDL